MKKINDVFKEVRNITQELIRCGLAEEFNFPVVKGTDVIWTGYTDISFYLKNMDYVTIYSEMEKQRNYNFKFPDGGIVQLMYRYNLSGEELQSHRLAFYPSPSFEIYQNDAELYDADYIYGDILNKEVLPVIIRADYNCENTAGKIHHPYSHITLGGYKNCRIPVDRPISPAQFVKFLMEHFYYVPSTRLDFNFDMRSIVYFEEHLAECDRKKSHLTVSCAEAGFV